jgi:sulfite exporter TauE/SafE
MLVSLLAVGFVLGVKHALDADHVAAVATLAARRASLGQTARVAAAWGVGHASVLLAFGAALVLLDARLPEPVAHLLEAAVGVMLIVLGLGVARRVHRRHLHVHVHQHDEGARHLHLHAHDRDRSRHDHPHSPGLGSRAMLIGCVHGLAGTAGLVLLAVPAAQSGPRALAYLVVFGLGTVLGMIGFSLLISVPLAWTGRRMARAAHAVDALLGAANLALGVWIAVASISPFFSN